MSPDTERWILRVSGLCKRYRDADAIRSVLENVHLDLDRGEVLAITGPSGSGKTTLLGLLAGVLEADAGSILLNTSMGPVDYRSLSRDARTRLRRRHIGYVFQFFNLVPTLTVRENVLLPLELNARADLAGEALARLELLGLSARLDDFPDRLSGGERQRTAIARALAHRPALVIADEPTGNLDAASAEQVADMLIREVRTSAGGLVIATHNDAIADRADRHYRLGR